MSGKCANCNCADSDKCVKKGSSYVADFVEIESSVSYVEIDVPAAEDDGKCKCSPICHCINCTCGGH